MTDYPEGTIFIEIRGIYDGWSCAKLPDGTMVNRWPEDDRKHACTQAWIEQWSEGGLRNSISQLAPSSTPASRPSDRA